MILSCLFMCHQEKKPYIDKAAELKALAENGEGSGVSPCWHSFPCSCLLCWYMYSSINEEATQTTDRSGRFVMQENNVAAAAEKAKADDTEGGQEVDQPVKRRRRKVDDDEDGEAGGQGDEAEKNELDDDM
jgi:high mobility group protein B3